MTFAKAVKYLALSASAFAALSQPVLAATCANDTDMAAFRTAAVQQQLMVAALTCKDVEVYNRFVLAYQPELQKSDADLKSYFIRRGNEAEYDTFKTKLANLSSLSDIANGPAYCENAAAAFDMALKNRQALSSFVADQRLMIAMPAQTMCSRPAEVLTAAAAPAPLTQARPAQVKLASAKPAPPVRLAAAEPASAAIAGVPAHEMPANPFGGPPRPAAEAREPRPAPEVAEAAPAPRSYDNASYDRADREEADLPLPPRPRRTLEASRREAYYAALYQEQAPRWVQGRPESDSYYGDGR